MLHHVITLDRPTDVQLHQMVKLTVDAFDKAPMINAMTGGIRERKVELYQLLLRAAALEGKICVCQNEWTTEIVSVGVCFGPGVDFLGSQAQLDLGADEFFNNLPEETRKWYNDVNIPMSKRFVEDTLGQQKVTDNWWIDSMATLESERGKGYASAILKDICKRAEKDGKLVALDASTESNVNFYQSSGFDVIGSADRPSPFGTWTNHMMVWDKF